MQDPTKIAFIIAVSLHAALGCVIPSPSTTRLPEAPSAYMEVGLCEAPSASDQESQPEILDTAPIEEISPPEPITESAQEPIEFPPDEPVAEPSPIVLERKPPAPVAKPQTPSSKPTTTVAQSKSSSQSKGNGSGTYQATGSVSFLHRPAPVYPSAALHARQTGRVVLVLYINEFGKVDRVETQTSSGVPSLDTAATTAAQKSTFRPAVSAGRPVKSKASVPFNFQIN